MIQIPGVLIVLDKIFVLTSLGGCLSWIGEYTWNSGWRNVIGRTLLAKTSLLAGLLALTAVSLFLPLDAPWRLALSWAGVILLGLIGPVMVWRLLVFRKVSKAVQACPNGHRISAARYCPQCGVLIPPPPGILPA